MKHSLAAIEASHVTWKNYTALCFALIFFSGLLHNAGPLRMFDFTSLNGNFGQLLAPDPISGVPRLSHFRGTDGHGALDGFLFSFYLIPTIMVALGILNVLEHYGALIAAKKLLTPAFRLLLGLPGVTGLSMIASLESVDIAASMTRELAQKQLITPQQTGIFAMFQLSGGALITNFFSSGALLFALKQNESSAMPISMGFCIALIFSMKIIGANLFRFYLYLQTKRVT